MKNCRNCDTRINQAFCPKCGQKASINRITLKELISDIKDSFGLNKGIFYTIKALFVNPKETIYNYLNGKRVVYFNPFKLWILSITLLIFTSTFTLSLNEVFKNFINTQNWLFINLILAVPLFSITTYLVSFRKFNIFENIVINLFIFSIINLATIIFNIFYFIISKLSSPSFSDNINYIFLLPYFILAYMYFKIFRKKFLLLILLSLMALIIFSLLVTFFLQTVYYEKT